MKTGLHKLLKKLTHGGTQLAKPWSSHQPWRSPNGAAINYDNYEDALRRAWATLNRRGAAGQNILRGKVVQMDEECENQALEMIRLADASWGCAPRATAPKIASVRVAEINGHVYPHIDMVAMGVLQYVFKYRGAAHIVQVFDGANKLLYEAEVPVDGCYTIRAAEPLRAHGVLDSTKRKLIIIGVAASEGMSEECLCKSSQYHYEISKDDYLEYIGAPEWNPI
jgi:hypothetical protein